MPVKTYKCGECGKQYDELVMSEDPVACKHCGAEKLTRIFGTPGVHFKGSGFHATDYNTTGGVSTKRREKSAKESS